MVCPFRVVVILLSLTVALIAALIALAEPIKEHSEHEAEPIIDDRTWRQKLWDFWTGRYLLHQYERYAAHVNHSKPILALSLTALVLALTAGTMALWSHQTGSPLWTK